MLENNKNRTVYGKLLALIIAGFFLTGLIPAVKSSVNPDSMNAVIDTKTLDRDIDPVVMLGSQISGFAGYDVNHIFVWAFTGGAWKQVVFQIDEANGFFVSKSGGQAGPHKNYYIADDGVLDNDDELVFMANETGDRVNAAEWAPGADTDKDRLEITVSDPITGNTGWVYLYYYTTPPSWTTVDYASWDEANNDLVMYGYSLNYNNDDDRMLYYTEMNIDPNIGGDDVDLVDRNKRTVSFNSGGVQSPDKRSEGGNSNEGLKHIIQAIVMKINTTMMTTE